MGWREVEVPDGLRGSVRLPESLWRGPAITVRHPSICERGDLAIVAMTRIRFAAGLNMWSALMLKSSPGIDSSTEAG
jgi:hypothetical protein